jgi:alpha-amylase
MFEWPWKDVARECESYLGPAGFAAVQVSPPHEHIVWQNHPWWERYQVVSYKIDSRGGNEADFSDMVKRCHRVGVDIYVDAVINHMTGIPGGNGISGTAFGHYNYPGIYQSQDFHHCGRNGNDDIQNYDDRYEVQNCEMLDLADLATESDYVRDRIAGYLNHLLDLGVAGFRIDAAKHIPANDLQAILSRLHRSAYIYSEVITGSGGVIQFGEYMPFGDVMAYGYSEVIANAVRSKNMDAMINASNGFFDSAKAIVFLTNHDLERGSSVLSYNGNESRMYQLAQIFLLAWPYGYPQLYSGYAFNDREAGPALDQNLRSLPVLDGSNNCVAPFTCEHRLPEVAAMVNFRNQTDGSFNVQKLWSNHRDVIAFSRGNQGFVAINFGDSPLEGDFLTTLPDGQYCNVLDSTYRIRSGRCANFYSVSQGRVHVSIAPQTAFVLLQQTNLLQSKKK